MPALYSELAGWWPLLSAPEDYREEAAFYRKALLKISQRKIETVVEFGSGGGNNASHMKEHFDLTLVDLSSRMLAVSRELNPECEHIVGDMRKVRLDRKFDAVFIHDAISYITTRVDLRSTVETAFIHCRPGGAVLLAPDHTRESFSTSTSHGGHDSESRSLRYLQWTWDPDPADDTYQSFMVYVLREQGKVSQVIEDMHTCGLFSEGEWLEFMEAAGFSAKAIDFDHSEVELEGLKVFMGVKPGGGFDRVEAD